MEGRSVWQLWVVSAMVFAVWMALGGRAEAQLGALVSPGRLAKAHANLEGISNCLTCHEQGNKVTARKCLACHAPIAARVANKRGVHRSVTTDCVGCHAEHAGVDADLRPFDTRAFNHATATGFPLDGRHAPLANQCAACHKGRSFLTLSSACASCHADVHKGSLGASCVSCHGTNMAFKSIGKQFDHSKAAFHLAGAHKSLACTSCHAGNTTFKGVKFASCTDCHRDPHKLAFGATCTSCHTNESWRTKAVNHTRTKFPLLGAHARVDCAGCHKQPATKVKPASATCAACHSDVHRGTFKQDCKTCHSESAWGRAPFDHTTTAFQLTGRHDGLSCEKCHRTTTGAQENAANRAVDFRGLKTTCMSCHTDVHEGELGQTCEQCHTSVTFRVANHTHTRLPEFFAGRHTAVTCEQCHVPDPPSRPFRTGAPVLAVKFKRASTTCTACHTDVHLGQEVAPCDSCHTIQTAKFSVAGFAHGTRTAFDLTGRHAAIECAACHKVETGVFPAGQGTARRLKGVATACLGCHADVHLGQVGDRCEACHQTTSFKVTGYKHHQTAALSQFFLGKHATATCAACHQQATRSFPRGSGTAVQFDVSPKCVTCHADIHRGSLGTDCGACHRP